LLVPRLRDISIGKWTTPGEKIRVWVSGQF
jgi:hypothetical protein